MHQCGTGLVALPHYFLDGCIMITPYTFVELTKLYSASQNSKFTNAQATESMVACFIGFKVLQNLLENVVANPNSCLSHLHLQGVA